jgi:hypothetical protein
MLLEEPQKAFTCEPLYCAFGGCDQVFLILAVRRQIYVDWHRLCFMLSVVVAAGN